MIGIPEARKLILTHARDFGVERVKLQDSAGRILAESVTADRDYPPFDRSAMDGYAVKAKDVFCGVSLELVYDLRAGDIFPGEVLGGQCVRIMTGAPVPEGADAVIPSEQARPEGSRVRFTIPGTVAGRHIAHQGEDTASGQLLLSKGSLITPAVMATLAMVGCGNPRVVKAPEVRVFSTGNEVRPLGASLAPYHIRDVNGYALSALFRNYGIRVPYSDPLADDPIVLQNAFRKEQDAALLVVSGGVSKGAADLIPEVLTSLGILRLFHRVKIKPGNPLWVGVSGEGQVVFALPGNPVAVQVGFKVFIEPYLRHCFGMSSLLPLYLPLRSSRKARTVLDEYFPVALCNEGGPSHIVPVPFNGSGDARALAYSSGIALHPAGSGSLEVDEPVAFFPWKPDECFFTKTVRDARQGCFI